MNDAGRTVFTQSLRYNAPLTGGHVGLYNGNISEGSVWYAGQSGTSSETISFSHDGNRLSSVSASAAYQYDSAGNLTYDPRKQLQFSYNVCNLPSSVRRDGEDSSLITYRYLSDGTKISAEAVLEPEIDEGAPAPTTPSPPDGPPSTLLRTSTLDSVRTTTAAGIR